MWGRAGGKRPFPRGKVLFLRSGSSALPVKAEGDARRKSSGRNLLGEPAAAPLPPRYRYRYRYRRPGCAQGAGGGRNAGSPVTRGWGGCWRGGDTHTRLVGRRARKSLNLKNTIPKKDLKKKTLNNPKPEADKTPGGRFSPRAHRPGRAPLFPFSLIEAPPPRGGGRHGEQGCSPQPFKKKNIKKIILIL